MALDLFSPAKLGSIALKNRMVMAPLTRSRAPKGTGVPQALNVAYYEQRATAGLIVTEATPISAMGHGYILLPGIYTDAQVAGWKKVTEAVHAKGGKIVLQLWHVGRISHPSLLNGALPVAPSAIKPAGQAYTYEGLVDFVEPRALEASELPAIVQEYVHATKCALAAGFDGVEIHAANGYLLDQFLRDGSNKRTDNYGGSFENRTRLLLEVTKAVIAVAGADKTGLRLSPVNPFNDMQDSNPQALFNYVADALNQFNLAYLHVVEGGMGGDTENFDFAELRKQFKGSYMANFGYDKARGNAAIASGHADVIAYGVPFLANPDLVERYKTDAPLNKADSETFYGGSEKGYTDYPTLSA
ncbi:MULTISPECIES: alkene reductase [Methylotenera]|uniref:alkene reductase n=1 Tax=Methylotenera TaxID=359407 RepID=UPI0003788449|nr:MULTISPECIES: alkene reductase [Methylotenera]